MTQPHTHSARLAYLGPEGSFTHQAAKKLAPEGVQLVPCSSLEQVIDQLLSGKTGLAVAAIDSAAGPIKMTQELIDQGKVKPLARTAISVSFDLYRQPGDSAELIGIMGHEKALAQIQTWIDKNGVETDAVASNTLGLENIARGRPAWGAVGPPGLSSHYGLDVVAHALEHPAQNQTHFVLIESVS